MPAVVTDRMEFRMTPPKPIIPSGRAALDVKALMARCCAGAR
jgi:hypothetical protein